MDHPMKYFVLTTPLALALLTFALAGPAYAAENGSLAITNATIIDGTGARPIRKGTIIIENGLITIIGKARGISIPPGIRIVDANGKFIIPGMIDANLHLYLNTDLESLIKFEDRYHEVVLEGAQIALKTGQTTVFDTWGPRAALVKARDMINDGTVPGSRIYLAGNIIGFGGPFSTDFNAAAAAHVSQAFVARTNETWEQGTGQSLLWAGQEDVRNAVQKYIGLDVDFLKYGASGHALFEMRFITFSPRVQGIIVEEAHKAGLTVQTHSSTTESLDMAIDAGVDILTHCGVSGMSTPLADETIQKMADQQVPCSALAITQARVDAMTEADPNNPFLGFMTTMKDNHRRMIEAGVIMLVSTDAGIRNPVLASEATGAAAVEVDARTTLGEGHFNALVGLQEMGMKPMEILKSITSHTAKAYKKNDEIGSLVVGKQGDLLILEDNPLQDAVNYRSIDSVVKGGIIVDVDALPLNPVITGIK
jgi:imidazolonepropionase-like amidohydrolase